MRKLLAVLSAFILLAAPAVAQARQVPPSEYTLIEGTGWQYPDPYTAPDAMTFTPTGVDGYWAIRLRQKCDSANNYNEVYQYVSVDRWQQLYYGEPYQWVHYRDYYLAVANTDDPGEVDEIEYLHNPNYSQKIDGHNTFRIQMSNTYVYRYGATSCQDATQIWSRTS